MKNRVIVLLLVLFVLLTACGKEANTEKQRLLEFPGLKWGMTPEEVKTALNISEDMITKEMSTDGEFSFTVLGLQYFGNGTDHVVFKFAKAGDDKTGRLYLVKLYYPEETDMAVIRDNLVKIYGPGTDYGFTNYVIDHGTVQSYIDWNRGNNLQYGTTIENNAKRPTPLDEINHRWASSVPGSELFDDEALDRACKVFRNDDGEYVDRDIILDYLEKHVWVTIRCTDNPGEWGEGLPNVTFNAEHVVFAGNVD